MLASMSCGFWGVHATKGCLQIQAAEELELGKGGVASDSIQAVRRIQLAADGDPHERSCDAWSYRARLRQAGYHLLGRRRAGSPFALEAQTGPRPRRSPPYEWPSARS